MIQTYAFLLFQPQPWPLPLPSPHHFRVVSDEPHISKHTQEWQIRVHERSGGAPCHQWHWENAYKIPHKCLKLTHFSKGNRQSPRRENPRTALSDTTATGPMWPLSIWSVASPCWAALQVQNTHGWWDLVWKWECQRSHQSFLYRLHVKMVFWILC